MKKSMLMGALALMGAAAPSMADMANGGFEFGDFTNWSIRAGTTKDPGTVGKWPGQWEKDVTWTGYQNWPGKPNSGVSSIKAAVIDASANLQQYVPKFNTPLDGSKQAIINFKPGVGDIFLQGDYDVTHISRKARVDPADVDPTLGKYVLRVNWAGMIENPGHPDENEPGFYIRLGKKTGAGAWVYLLEEFHEGNQQGQNQWTLAPTKRRDGHNPDADLYYKAQTSEIEVGLGDSVSVDMVTIDCAWYGHGTVAFIDAVGFAPKNPCPWNTCDIDTVGMPCLYGYDSLVLSSDAKVTADLGTNGKFVEFADAKATGSARVKGLYKAYDRARLFGGLIYSGVIDTSKSPGNEARITGAKTKKSFVFKSMKTYQVTPGSSDVNVWNGLTVNLVPGAYKNLNANGGILKFTAGTYHFNTVTLNQPTVVYFDNTNGPINILAQGQVLVRDIVNHTINPVKDPATAVLLYSNSANSNYNTPAIAVEAGTNVLNADLLAPMGVANVRQRVVYGYSHSKWARVEASANFTCREGYVP